MKRFNFAFTVSDLANYVHENEENIISASIFGAKTQSLINVMVGIKSSEEITTLETNAEFQADSGCSYNTSGATTFSNRALSVSKIMVSETLCPEDLEAKFLQRKVQPGGKHDQLPFEQEIMDLKTRQLAKNLEMAIWQGDTSQTYSTNLKQFNGLLNIIDNATGVVAGNTSGASDITAGNAFGIFQDMYEVVPADILGADDLVYLCGWDTFRLLQSNIMNNNLFHYTAEAANGEMRLPGTDIPVIAVHGLNAGNHASLPAAKQDRIILARKSNLYFGTDMLHEEEEWDLWYSKDDRNIKTLFTFKAGTQIGFPSEIVQYTNA